MALALFPSCPSGFASGSALDCSSLDIGLLGFLVGTETKWGFAGVLDCDAGLEFTADPVGRRCSTRCMDRNKTVRWVDVADAEPPCVITYRIGC